MKTTYNLYDNNLALF